MGRTGSLPPLTTPFPFYVIAYWIEISKARVSKMYFADQGTKAPLVDAPPRRISEIPRGSSEEPVPAPMVETLPFMDTNQVDVTKDRDQGLPSEGQTEPHKEAMTHSIPDEVDEPISLLATSPSASQPHGNLTVGTVPAADRNLSRDSNGHLGTGPNQGTPISRGVPDIDGTVVLPRQENTAFRDTSIPKTSDDVTFRVFLRFRRRLAPPIPDPSPDPYSEPQKYAIKIMFDYDSVTNRYWVRWTSYDLSRDTMEPAKHIPYNLLFRFNLQRW